MESRRNLFPFKCLFHFRFRGRSTFEFPMSADVEKTRRMSAASYSGRVRCYYSAHSEFRFSSLYILLYGNRHTYLASHLHNYATSKNGYSVSDRPCISKARQKVQVTQWWLAPLRWQTCFLSPPRRPRSAVIAIHDFRTKLLATRETSTKPTS